MTVAAAAHPTRPQPDLSDAERAAIIARLRRLAWLLDSSVRIPGTRLTIGLDPIVGLAPGIGDALMLIASAYIIVQGYRLGASRRTLTKMTLNVAIDALTGTVPIAGDIFDAAWKANHRNLRLLGITPTAG